MKAQKIFTFIMVLIVVGGVLLIANIEKAPQVAVEVGDKVSALSEDDAPYIDQAASAELDADPATIFQGVIGLALLGGIIAMLSMFNYLRKGK